MIKINRKLTVWRANPLRRRAADAHKNIVQRGLGQGEAGHAGALHQRPQQLVRIAAARYAQLPVLDFEQLMFDPEVLKAVEDEAKARDEPKSVTHARAKRYGKEIVPAFSAYTYFRIGAGLAKWLSTALYRVRVGAFEEAELYKVPPDASVVFVINHRSNMDYVLVTYLVSQSSALSYAVGEWARVWALQGLIRAMGGYFVRRDSSNALYRKVLARYVHMATASGVTQAVFPEGGLTRDGKLRPPKLGLLSYMVSGFDPNGARDIVFVPVGINYDRVLEDRSLLRRGDPSAAKVGLGRTLFADRHGRHPVFPPRRDSRQGFFIENMRLFDKNSCFGGIVCVADLVSADDQILPVDQFERSEPRQLADQAAVRDQSFFQRGQTSARAVVAQAEAVIEMN
jgi:1-acyl-sn-glycerol-3-phosphate acyltransferase